MTEIRELHKEMYSQHILTQAIYFQVCGASQTAVLSPPAPCIGHLNQQPPARLQSSHASAVTTLAPLPTLPPAPVVAPMPTPTLPSTASSSPLTSSPNQPDAPELPHLLNSIVVRDTMIVYDRNCLIAPPYRNYAANLELLVADWEHLTITLHPGQLKDIGVKFWKQLYLGTKHWARLRKPYSNWTVRVLRSCSLVSPELGHLTSSTVCHCCTCTVPDSRPVLGGILN